MVVDRLAVDVVHDQVWTALRGCASIEEANDIRVIQYGKSLPLVVKPPNELFLVRSGLHQLERNKLPKTVGSFGQVHGTHPTATNAPNQVIVSDHPVFENIVISVRIARKRRIRI
jgi:hypothetical protein